MVSDTVYDAASPVLTDDTILDEEKADKIEDVLREKLGLTGRALEDAVLGVLWKHRGANGSSVAAPVRATVIRRPSPAPWQLRSPTPGRASSPRSTSALLSATPPGYGIAPPAVQRAKSFTTSPSPKQSPRLAHITPQIPHSPCLSAYQFSEPSPILDHYGDMGSENVDWLVNDDASSTTSWTDNGSAIGVADYMQPAMADMTPYDLLRSILRDDKSDGELNKLLELNGYDLSATIASLLDSHSNSPKPREAESVKTYLVGKSMLPTSRPATPSGQSKTPVVCRYFLASGQCARADCRFSHDLTNHLCKYWMSGNCLAGDSCMFSHDPSLLVARIAVQTDGQSNVNSASLLEDSDTFPALQRSTSNPSVNNEIPSPAATTPQPSSMFAMNPFANFVPGAKKKMLPDSRPTSRQTSRATTPSNLSFQDDEAFPTLGSAAGARSMKRQQGKRGQVGHATPRDSAIAPSSSSSLADIVKSSSPLTGSPTPALQIRKDARSRENNAAIHAIPAPEHIPWLETGQAANTAYLKARAEAFRHGSLRNKFLQGAAQAWNRNDARGAKALSLRGQSEKTLMKEAHREAARVLYEGRNKNGVGGAGGKDEDEGELYVDLHGLHPEEATSYLQTCLDEQKQVPSSTPSWSRRRPLYVICGTGHHSRNGRDKVGRAVRAYLTDLGYAFREFSVPGDRSNLGGIIGVIPGSGSVGEAGAGAVARKGGSRALSRSASQVDFRRGCGTLAGGGGGGGGGGGVEGKVRVVSAEEAARVK